MNTTVTRSILPSHVPFCSNAHFQLLVCTTRIRIRFCVCVCVRVVCSSQSATTNFSFAILFPFRSLRSFPFPAHRCIKYYTFQCWIKVFYIFIRVANYVLKIVDYLLIHIRRMNDATVSFSNCLTFPLAHSAHFSLVLFMSAVSGAAYNV